MNGIMTSNAWHRCSRWGLIVLLVLAAGCSRGNQNKAETRYGAGTAADTMGTAPGQSAGTRAAPEPPAATRAPQAVTLPAGTHIVAALQSSVSTASARAGDKINLRTLEPVEIGGRTVVPTGSTINGQVTYAKGPNRIHGEPELTLRFTGLVLPDGRSAAISCDPFRVVGKNTRKRSLEGFGGGAAAGAAVGGLLGHSGRGALEGAAIGGILGTGVAVATNGQQLELPAGQRLSVDLTSPVTLPASR